MNPGWYQDPPGRSGNWYWDGHNWSPGGGASIHGAKSANRTSRPEIDRNTAVAVGVCILSAIGLVMSLQSASLLTGTGQIWTGVGVAAAGTAAAYFLRAANWVRTVSTVMLILALLSAGYMEHQLSQKRDEISHMFDGSQR